MRAGSTARVAIVGLLVAGCSPDDAQRAVTIPTPPRAEAEAPPAAPAAAAMRLRVVPIVDEEGTTASLYAGAPSLPAGGRIVTMNVQAGESLALVTTVHVDPSPGEPLDEARQRVRRWADGLRPRLPPGMAIEVGPLLDVDPHTLAGEQVGWQTYLVRDAPLLVEADVAGAEARRDQDPTMPFVSIELTPEGGRRFAEATRAHVRRRIAIVVDGRVVSAPVVMTPIVGGRLSLTLGAGSPEHQWSEAQRIAAGLAPTPR